MDEKNKPLVDVVESNGNRVSKGEAIEALSDRYGGEERAEKAIDAMVDDCDHLETDRFGGKERIEKVVY
jgi:hypothetical protein